MDHYFDASLQKNVYRIGIGEFVSTNEPNAILSTLLGSCISVCLTDDENGVFGMNHFILPGNDKKEDNPRYGKFATNHLIEHMLNKGANIKHITAKIYGAGRVSKKYTFDIGKNNLEFIQKYLKDMNIPIVESDVGGEFGRKIHFHCDSSDIVVEKFFT